jgi:pyruvate dehydrogenase E1 component alpha subunit
MSKNTMEIDQTSQQRRESLYGDRKAKLARMVEIRLLEDSLKVLASEGFIAGTMHTCQGEEAIEVALAATTRPDDIVVGTYRGHGHALALGLTPKEVIGEVLGRTSGCIGGIGGSMHLSDPEIGLLPTFAIVGANLPVAVGAALSAWIRGTDQISVAVFGDGASNIGAFHESMNLAAVWKLPCIFLLENNQYAAQTPIERSTAVTDLALRGVPYGIPSVTVDGQDLDVMEAAITTAVDRARAGGGPTLIVAMTFKFGGHSYSDVPSSYLAPGELDEWLKRDPIELFGNTLIEEGVCTAADIEQIWKEQKDAINSAVAYSRDAPKPELIAMFPRPLKA